MLESSYVSIEINDEFELNGFLEHIGENWTVDNSISGEYSFTLNDVVHVDVNSKIVRITK